MVTLDQQRAVLAHTHVSQVADLAEGSRKKYASIVHALPVLLRSAGLSQALHFVASRPDEDQRRLLDHLAAQLGRADAQVKDAGSLLHRARQADLAAYLRLTGEALACSAWYRRMVQGVLRIEAGATDVSD